MFYQIFLPQHVKQCTIITYKYGRYELPHKLPNDLMLLSHMVSMVLVRLKVGAILGNGYGIQGQNYVALL